jgi:hypothetical protein
VRRRRHEFDVLTEVVVPALAVRTAATRDARFEGDSVSRFEGRDVLPDVDDHTGTLVPEDEWVLDDVVTDTAVFVVVNVGATDADVAHGHEHVLRAGSRSRSILEFELARFY